MTILIINCLFAALMVVPFFLARHKPAKIKYLTLASSVIIVATLYVLFTYWAVGVSDQMDAEDRTIAKAKVETCLASLMEKATADSKIMEQDYPPTRRLTDSDLEKLDADVKAHEAWFDREKEACFDLYDDPATTSDLRLP